jgi:hypothetical protein
MVVPGSRARARSSAPSPQPVPLPGVEGNGLAQGVDRRGTLALGWAGRLSPCSAFGCQPITSHPEMDQGVITNQSEGVLLEKPSKPANRANEPSFAGKGRVGDGRFPAPDNQTGQQNRPGARPLVQEWPIDQRRAHRRSRESCPDVDRGLKEGQFRGFEMGHGELPGEMRRCRERPAASTSRCCRIEALISAGGYGSTPARRWGGSQGTG